MGWAMGMLKGVGGIRKVAATWHTSRFIRKRNCTTFAAVAEEVEKNKKEGSGKNEDKSLYLCFEEYRGRDYCWTYSLQSMGLSHLLQGRSTSTDISGNGDHNSRLELHESAFRGGSHADVPKFLSLSPKLASKYIFTSSSAHDRGIVEWVPKTLQPNPYLLEVDGKIFRFRFSTNETWHSSEPFQNCESFEVFDPNDSQWLPLDRPPCVPVNAEGYVPSGLIYKHAIAGSNILRWVGKCTSRFDVNRPDQGWTELNSSVGRWLRGHAQVFFLDLHQQDRDRDHDHDGYLMFFCDWDDFDSTIHVALMSQECDSLEPMQPLQLPQLLPGCPDDIEDFSFVRLGGRKVGRVPGCPSRPEDYSFVHLGGRKVGLVLKSSKLAYPMIPVYDMVHIFLITFEYELITTEDALDVKTRLLTTRCLEYEPGNRSAQFTNLIGAYVL